MFIKGSRTIANMPWVLWGGGSVPACPTMAKGKLLEGYLRPDSGTHEA